MPPTHSLVTQPMDSSHDGEPDPIDRQNVASDLCGIVGQSEPMQRVFKLLRRAAASSSPVMILGETGTGKELVAKAIHSSGIHYRDPFVPIDCPSLPAGLIESELFGYSRGAFTGAVSNKIGLFLSAQSGTLFLDEIGDLALGLQSTLLGAIERRAVRALGAVKAIPFNARLVAATNRNLQVAVREGTFREDLYYRLMVLSIEMPPLRARKTDIPLLAEAILKRIGFQIRSGSSNQPLILTQDALSLLISYDWPGNVRELQNCLERAAVLGDGSVITSADIRLSHCPSGVESPHVPFVGLSLRTLERDAILRAMAFTRGDKLAAARLLRIGKTTLYRRLRAYKLDSAKTTGERAAQ